MKFHERYYYKTIMIFLLGFATLTVHAKNPPVYKHTYQSNHSYKQLSFNHYSWLPKIVIQAGGYNMRMPKGQSLNIDGLIGDHFYVTQKNASNVIVGAGLYFNGPQWKQYDFSYGVNTFYFFPVTVQGGVTQEEFFNNLSYSYTIANWPVYLMGKTRINFNDNKNYHFTLDAGIGPNFIKTSTVMEKSLDGGQTIPDTTFTGRTTGAFSATFGIGVEFKNALDTIPVECGYRFFYLGQGSFGKANNSFIDTLKPGNNVANALLCSMSF
jgi:hypothetical protein